MSNALARNLGLELTEKLEHLPQKAQLAEESSMAKTAHT
jgi:hypothetical protein